jgi:threonine/homoserine/homoserine lactone efflux protein
MAAGRSTAPAPASQSADRPMPDLATLIPDWTVLAAFAVAVVAITLTPGPDMTLFLGKTVSQSRAAGLAAFAGAATGLLIHTGLVALGLSALLAASAAAFVALKIAGAAYLAWLAWQALRRGSSLALGRSAAQPIARVYATGLLVNLLNPKIIVFFVTFLPQFVAPADPHAAAKLFFLGVAFVVMATPICVAMILSADRIAGWLKRSPRATRAVDWLFAGVMAGFAVRLVLAEARG